MNMIRISIRTAEIPMRSAVVVTLLCLGFAASAAGQTWFTAASPSREEPDQLEGLLSKAKTLVGDRMGESGIGFCAGAACGYACKQVLNTISRSIILGVGVAGGACLAGYTKPEELLKRAEDVGEQALQHASKTVGKLNGLMNQLDQDGDGKLTASEAKLTLSKFAHRHAGLTAGFVGGAVVGYKVG
jgi:uncharacterized membrane protein (Fun14 family)